jgi:hypothetical protein
MEVCDGGQEWFAFSDGHLEPLGVCLDFEQADQKAPLTTHWLFSRESLQDFVKKADNLLLKSQCEDDLARAGIDTLSPAIEHLEEAV